MVWFPVRGNANDASGNGLNGTFVGDAKLLIDERVIANSAVEFDTFANAVVVATSTKFNMSDSFTNAFKFMSIVDKQRQDFIRFENYNTDTAIFFQIGKLSVASPLISGGVLISGQYVCGNIPVAADLLGINYKFYHHRKYLVSFNLYLPKNIF